MQGGEKEISSTFCRDLLDIETGQIYLIISGSQSKMVTHLRCIRSYNHINKRR
jgi:hypothetical protein